jgi:hypothetical protein
MEVEETLVTYLFSFGKEKGECYYFIAFVLLEFQSLLPLVLRVFHNW